MDKPFNQNSSTSDSNHKDSQDFQSLKQCLEVSEARSYCLLATLPQIAWLAQVNGAITNFNQRWYEYTGLTIEESLGWKFLKAIHPEDQGFLRASYKDSDVCSTTSASQVQAVNRPNLTNVKPESSESHKQEEAAEEQTDDLFNELLPASYLSDNGTPKFDASDLLSVSLDYIDVSSDLESKKLQNSEIECRIRGKDGVYHWFILRRIPVLGRSGQLLEWVGTFTLKKQSHPHSSIIPWQQSTEIQSRKTASQLQVELTTQLSVGKPPPPNFRVKEPAKKRSVELVQKRQPNLLSELSQTIIWEVEAKTGQFTFVSQSAERLFGYPVEQWLTQPDFWLNLVHPEDRQWTVALYRRQLLKSRDCELEYRCIAADNRVIWLRDRACVIRDDQGKIYKRRGLMVDITLHRYTRKLEWGKVKGEKVMKFSPNDQLD